MKKSPDAPAVTREAEEDWGEDTRRKSDIVPLTDFPYLVELALPPGGFRSARRRHTSVS
jgi:hypothetical protein